MVTTEQDFSSLEPGGHLCLAFVSDEESHRTVAAFVREGLKRGERCVYASGPAHLDGVAALLGDAGLPVAQLRERGALVLANADEMYLTGGAFDPPTVLARIAAAIDGARADGFAGYRGVGETFREVPAAASPAIAAYEAAAGDLLKEKRALGLCSYDRRLCAHEVMASVLRTHPLAVLGGRLCENPFCDPAAYTLGNVGEDRRVDFMINYILHRHEAEQYLTGKNDALIREAMATAVQSERLRRREDGLVRAVESRDLLIGMLGRQLRQPIPALLESLATLQQAAASVDGMSDDLDRLHEAVEAIVRIGERIEEAAEFTGASRAAATKCEPLDLVALTRAAIHEFKSRGAPARDGDRDVGQRDAGIQSDITFRLRAPEVITGTWDGARLHQVISGLLRAAANHGWGTPVELTLEEYGPLARIEVRHRGFDGDPAAPRAQRERLDVELWTAREIVRQMGGTLGVSGWPDGRVTFTVELPRQSEALAGKRSLVH
jgi:signal transduction histidine kinase